MASAAVCLRCLFCCAVLSVVSSFGINWGRGRWLLYLNYLCLPIVRVMRHCFTLCVLLNVCHKICPLFQLDLFETSQVLLRLVRSTRFVGNSEDWFCRVKAHLISFNIRSFACALKVQNKIDVSLLPRRKYLIHILFYPFKPNGISYPFW